MKKSYKITLLVVLFLCGFLIFKLNELVFSKKENIQLRKDRTVEANRTKREIFFKKSNFNTSMKKDIKKVENAGSERVIESAFNGDLKKAFCMVKNSKKSIPLSLKSRVSGFFGPSVLANGDLGNSVMTMLVSDEECPYGKYSIVKMEKENGRWNEKTVLDCRKVSHESLFLGYGIQRYVEFLNKGNPLDYSFALNGEGLFVLSCSNGYKFTRLGQFSSNQENFIIDKEDCFLLDEHFKPIQVTGRDFLDDGSRCFNQSKQCILVTSRENLKNFNSKLLSPFSINIFPRNKSKFKKLIIPVDKNHTEVFEDTLEELDIESVYPSGMGENDFSDINLDIDCISDKDVSGTEFVL